MVLECDPSGLGSRGLTLPIARREELFWIPRSTGSYSIPPLRFPSSPLPLFPFSCRVLPSFPPTRCPSFPLPLLSPLPPAFLPSYPLPPFISSPLPACLLPLFPFPPLTFFPSPALVFAPSSFFSWRRPGANLSEWLRPNVTSPLCRSAPPPSSCTSSLAVSFSLFRNIQ